jgi:uncharacterized protein involved in exopolysaccharide biosynthesis
MQFTSWNLKTILLAFAVTGAAIAAAVAFSIPSQYQSTSVMQITTAGPAQADARSEVNKHMNHMEQEILSRTSLAELIAKFDLYKARRGKVPIEDIIQDMRNHEITIKPVKDRGNRQDSQEAFTISYTYPDPKLAQAVTRELVTKFIEQNVRTQRGGGVRIAENLEVLDPASQPMQPIYPLPGRFAFAGLCAGLLAGLTVAFASRWRISIVRRPAH